MCCVVLRAIEVKPALHSLPELREGIAISLRRR